MRRKLFSATLLFLYLFNLVPFALASETREERRDNDKSINKTEEFEANDPDFEDPDLPPGGRKISKDDFLRGRQEQVSLLRGLPYPKINSRQKAIFEMESKENALRAATGEPDAAPQAVWQPLGPAPIPNGQTVGRTDPVSGRVSAIAVHPTNPNIVYVGTAQGGLYRSLDGGANWTPLLDNALSLAIGSVAIAPSDPSIVYVGTGEAAFSADSFFGVGIYRINNADTNPTVTGPLNRDAANNDVFTGRSVSEILVHPTDPNILFATTTNGVGGIGGNAPAAAAFAGLYRTSNATSAAPTFERLNVSIAGAVSRATIDAVMEPGNPNRILVAVVGSGGDGGIYVTNNALDPAPAFTRTLTTPDGSTNGRTELTIQKSGDSVTVYAASGISNGTVFKSIDGGATFAQTVANGFCNPQCFYDIAIAVDPNDANRVYLGGSPALAFGISTNGGTSFVSSSTGLHVDTQAIAVSPSNPNVIYFGSDGGIWVSSDAGASWLSRNNASFSATQFMSISLHPTDRYFTLGGTQDNGTQFLRPNNSWVRATGGDGGFSAVDQNATDTTNVTGYHTFFNSTGSQIGFQRITTFNGTGTLQPGSFLGCGGTANGLACADPVLFYAPMTRGPGNPNTLYFGTNKLYRSSDRGTTMTPVSQAFSLRVSAIGISPTNDNVRLVGTTGGQVYATTDGSATMTDVTGSIPARYIGRIKVAGNSTTAYVAVGGFGIPAGQHIWKTTNLGNNTATFAPAGNGIPDVPVNALEIDPADATGNTVYAGTDIGVFRTVDGGANWTPFSDNLPRVAVFDMAMHPVYRFLRIATHGRGIWEMDLNTATRRPPADFDGDGKTDVSVFRPNGGFWYILNSLNNNFRGEQFGASGDVPAPGDFDGDGRADLAVFRQGNWFISQSSNNAFRAVQFGAASDKPVAADYDGDGKTDVAVFRSGSWYILQSATNQFRGVSWGLADDLPVPGDYDADGKFDIAVFRPSNGSWYVLKSSDNAILAAQFGANGDKPVAGDYDNDGKYDFAVYRPAAGAWYVLQSTAGFRGVGFGIASDIPAQGDFDGDGRTDFGVFRPSDGIWYILLNANGQLRAASFGANGDVPAPSAYNPLR